MTARAASERARRRARDVSEPRKTRRKAKAPPADEAVPPLFNPDLWLSERGAPIGRLDRARGRAMVRALTMGCQYTAALKKAGLTHPAWRALVRHYPKLLADAQEASAIGLEMHKTLRLEAAHRRAVEGWTEPVFYEGEEVGGIPRFSDRILERLLRADDPDKFSDRSDITHHGGVVIESAIPRPKPLPPGV